MKDHGTPTNTADDKVKFIPAAGFTGTANFTYVIGIANNTTISATGSEGRCSTGSPHFTISRTAKAPP